MAPKPTRSWPKVQGETNVGSSTVFWRLAAGGIVNPRAGSRFKSITLSAKDAPAAATEALSKELVDRKLQEKLGGRMDAEHSLPTADDASSRKTTEAQDVLDALLNTATQQMDSDSNSEEDADERTHRLGAPLAFAHLGCVGGCDGVDCVPALDLPDGDFICNTCMEDDSNAQLDEQITLAAEAQLAARVAAATQPPPTLPAREPRRSSRKVKPVSRLQPEWSRYDLQRTGSRHARSRDETYAEVCEARDQLRDREASARRECGELASRLDALHQRLRQLTLGEVSDLSYEDCQAAAAVILGEAVTEIGDLSKQSAPQQPEASHDASWLVDGPVWMGGVEGTPGAASGELSLSTGYTTWNPSSGASDGAWQHIHLSDVLYAEIDDFDDVRAHSYPDHSPLITEHTKQSLDRPSPFPT